MKTLLVILSAVVLFSAVALAQSQRDQASQHYQQQQQQQQQPAASHQSQQQAHGDLLKSAGGKVTRREYPYDNSYMVIGLCLIPLLILLCFPLFSTPYFGGHSGGHHGGHHGGWGWGRSAKDTDAVQERVLKSVEG